MVRGAIAATIAIELVVGLIFLLGPELGVTLPDRFRAMRPESWRPFGIMPLETGAARPSRQPLPPGEAAMSAIDKPHRSVQYPESDGKPYDSDQHRTLLEQSGQGE